MSSLSPRISGALSGHYRLDDEIGAGGMAFAVGEQRVLFPFTPYVRLGPFPSYAVTADDKRFLVLREGQSAQDNELIVALHWLDGLKGKTGR